MQWFLVYRGSPTTPVRDFLPIDGVIAQDNEGALVLMLGRHPIRGTEVFRIEPAKEPLTKRKARYLHARRNKEVREFAYLMGEDLAPYRRDQNT